MLLPHRFVAPPPLLLLLLLACCSVLSRVSANSATSLFIDAQSSAHAVSPLLWGQLLEDLNHGITAGMDAQLVKNGWFQESTTVPWSWWGCWTIALSSTPPLVSPVNRDYLRVLAWEGQTCVLSNSGFYGIGVKANTAYTVSFYARMLQNSAASETVVAGLRSADGSTVYGSVRVQVNGGDWVKYSAQFTTDQNMKQDGSGQFFLSTTTRTELGLHMVSLVPSAGWRGLSFLRADIAELIAGMHPALLRFPGGAFVEGYNNASMYRWKNAVGPLEHRPGHPSHWGYFTPDSVGFLEMLQFAETLGAAPLWVLNCGMANQPPFVPIDELGLFVQDALDSIEFANGDESTPWGKLRAQYGHPAPFNLKHVAIGNEQQYGGYTNEYAARYAIFYQALKSTYPYLTIVANTLDVQSSAVPVEVYEVHTWGSPVSFRNDERAFDWQPRDEKSAKVFVSEYAVSHDWAGEGNSANHYTFNAALGESSYMVGMERNSDLVTMSCYAPLLVNDQDHNWDPDAIVINTLSAYGTPSYYLQSMFASERGTDVLKLSQTPATGSTKQLDISATARTNTNTSAAARDLIFKLVNFGSTDLDTSFNILLPTDAWRMMDAQHIRAQIMTAQPNDKNSFDTPTRVSPVASVVSWNVSYTGVLASAAMTIRANTIAVLVVPIALVA